MSEYSFDIVCKVNQQELHNAIDIALKEIQNRFDFKGAIATIKTEKENLQLEASDEMRMKQMIEVLESKIVKRDIDLKAFEYGKFESNVSGMVKCKVSIQQGLTQEQAKKISNIIKESKLKVQTRIQGDSVRVVAKSKDDLQEVIAMLRGSTSINFALSFENYK